MCRRKSKRLSGVSCRTLGLMRAAKDSRVNHQRFRPRIEAIVLLRLEFCDSGKIITVRQYCCIDNKGSDDKIGVSGEDNNQPGEKDDIPASITCFFSKPKVTSTKRKP